MENNRSNGRQKKATTTRKRRVTSSKSKRWKPGDEVYFTRFPGEKHVVIATVPGGKKPINYKKEIDAGFQKYTPLMNKKDNLPYQQGGESLDTMDTWKKASYFVAGKPDKRWGYVIWVRRAKNEELSEEPVPDPDKRGESLYKRIK